MKQAQWDRFSLLGDVCLKKKKKVLPLLSESAMPQVKCFILTRPIFFN